MRVCIILFLLLYIGIGLEPVPAHAEEEPEPELIWACETQQDGDGNEFERCGLGSYQESCMWNEGVEECLTFFEFYEEEEDWFVDLYEEFSAHEHLSLSLTWNGSALAEPIYGSGTLGILYSPEPDGDLGLPPPYQAPFEDMLAAAMLTLQVYRGEVGSATLVHATAIVGTETAIELSFSEPGTYQVLLAATFPAGTDVPGYSCGGELCPIFEPRIDSLTWFMEHGRAYADGEEIAEPQQFEESGIQKDRMSTHRPLAYGIVEIEAVEAPATAGASNVLFLPGIKGSRLYRPADTCDPMQSLVCPGVKLWEPTGDLLLQDLFLNPDGTSARNDIYVKEGDIMGEVLGTYFYASFVNQMNALKAEGIFSDWRAAAYDWRLSLDDIVLKGVKRDDRIYFQESTDAPYLLETLRELAASSGTGKVSIVAHSNGGLVAKRLMQELERLGEESLVEQLILVGVPQAGAPQAMAGLLYGYGEALPKDDCAESRFVGWLCSLLGSRATARTLAEHSPMAYHLLPTASYFDQVQDPEHPVARFSALTEYASERARYSSSIDSFGELADFLAAADGGRVRPEASDTASANVLPVPFLEYASEIHARIDAWVPPEGVMVHQIAGWGMSTISGVAFYEQPKLFGGVKRMYRPMFVEDGDGVVPVPSALLMQEDSELNDNYWLNLADMNFGNQTNRKHGDLFEIDTLRILIRDVLLGQAFSLPEFITTTRPESQGSEKLIFFLHSPLSLELYDSNDRHLGPNDSGGFDDEIPDAEYGEFGDVKYIIAPADNYELKLVGEDAGVFSLDVQRVSGSETLSAFTIADAPATSDTIATMNVTEDLSMTGPLAIDEDGDGTIDMRIMPKEDEVVVFASVAARSEEEAEEERNTFGSRSQPPANVEPDHQASEIIERDGSLLNYATVATAVETVTATTLAATFIVPASEIQNANVAGSLSKDDEPRQTASAYDAVQGFDLMDWLSDILSGFWNWLTSILS